MLLKACVLVRVAPMVDSSLALSRTLTFVLLPASQVSLQVTLAILAATNAVGTLCTIFVPDAKRMTLKDGALRAQSMFEKLIGGQVCAELSHPHRHLMPRPRIVCPVTEHAPHHPHCSNSTLDCLAWADPDQQILHTVFTQSAKL